MGGEVLAAARAENHVAGGGTGHGAVPMAFARPVRPLVLLST